MTGQYYLRARYYNPVIARFTQEDTYYGDGLNLYTYCRNNPILNHDPTGHGTKENSPYSRKEQQYIDAGADPDTAKLETQCYPDAKSKQDLYNKYKSQGYNATDAKKLANYEIVHGEERAKNYAANNVKKSGPDYTPTSPRDNVNTDWRTQNRLNAQKKAGAGKSGSKGGSATSRPTWRQSELDAATDFPGYADQKSFINVKEVSYGTKGSVRPDYYKEGFSVDIKNYNIENASGRSNLARNIEKQYYQRIENLPNGTKQSVMIDIRGQSVSDEVLSELYDEIMRRTNNGVEILFKKD